MEHARRQLQQVPGLLHRMANLMGIEFHGELPTSEAVDQVLEQMWKFNQTYQLSHGVSGSRAPGRAEARAGRRGRGAPTQPGGRYPTSEQSHLPLWPLETPSSHDFVVGVLLSSLDQPMPGPQGSVQPLRSQDTALRLLDLDPVTRLPLSWGLLVLSPSKKASVVLTAFSRRVESY